MKRIIAVVFLVCALLNICTYATGREPVRIALIDTGVSKAAIASSNLGDGKNYIMKESGTDDTESHGTALASIIAGCNAAGIGGICPDAVIVPLVFYAKDESGAVIRGDANTLAQIIRDAVDIYRCDIINISAGAPAGSAALKNAVEYAEEKGVLIVSSAGNDGESNIYYPGAYESVLCVGAVNSAGDDAAEFSNRNSVLDILAPGESLSAATPEGEAKKESGTSVSTAYVTGFAASLMSENDELGAYEIRRILMSSARDIGSVGYDVKSGWGVLDELTAKKYAADKRIFRDVSRDKWYFETVNAAAMSGIVSGTDAVTFAPQSETSRAMVWTMLYRMSGRTEVSDGVWYGAAQQWAVSAGISDGTNPNAPITREQLATIIYRSEKSSGSDVSDSADLARFYDAGKVSSWARDALSWAVSRGIINGVSETELAPQKSVTRAEAAAMLYRMKNA